MTTAVDAAQVLAEGRTVTLTNGQTITVRFGFRTLAAVEKEWGSVGALAGLLATGLQGQLYTTIGNVLALMSDLSADEVMDLLDPTQLGEYGRAIDDSLDEALPKPKGGESGKAPTNGSPGETSTTSEPSDSDAPMPSSGT